MQRNRWSTVVRATFNRWRTVVSGTWKYDDPRLKMSHKGTARVWHFQPRVVLFPCPMNDCVSYVLSYGQLGKCWIIVAYGGETWMSIVCHRKNAHSLNYCSWLVVTIMTVCHYSATWSTVMHWSFDSAQRHVTAFWPAKQLIVGHATIKYDERQLKMSPSCDIFNIGFIIFECRTHYHASST